jgi:hypothetical protein
MTKEHFDRQLKRELEGLRKRCQKCHKANILELGCLSGKMYENFMSGEYDSILTFRTILQIRSALSILELGNPKVANLRKGIRAKQKSTN